MKKSLFLIFVFVIPVFLYSAEGDFDFNDIPKDVKYCYVIGVSFCSRYPTYNND